MHLLPTNSRGRDATQYPLLQTLFCHESAHHVDFFSFFFSVAMTQYTLGGYGELLWLRPNFSGRQDRREVPWPRRILKTKIPMEFHNFVFFFFLSSTCRLYLPFPVPKRKRSRKLTTMTKITGLSRDMCHATISRAAMLMYYETGTLRCHLELFVAVWNSLLPSGSG